MLNVNIREIIRRDRENSGIFISNVKFRLEPGFIYTITGHNGSGKTTLLKSITSLHDQRYFSVEGEVLYNNTNLLNADNNLLAEIRRNKIKYVFQDPGSSFNPLKKLDYYFRLFNSDKERLNELLDYFQLPRKEILSQMYVYELSGGMAQRLAILLPLYVKPDILILDEPNSAIDINMTDLLAKILVEYVKNNNAVVLMATQDISFAENITDYIGFINKGSFPGFYDKQNFFNGLVGDDHLRNFLTAYRTI